MKNLFDATVASQVKTRLGKLETLGQDDGGADAGALLGEYAVGGGRSDARKGSVTSTPDGAAGEANGVSERRPYAEEFADGEESDCGGRTRLGQGTAAVIRID